MDFFQLTCTTVLHNPQLVESRELQIWRLDCKVIHRFLAVWKSVPQPPCCLRVNRIYICVCEKERNSLPFHRYSSLAWTFGYLWAPRTTPHDTQISIRDRFSTAHEEYLTPVWKQTPFAGPHSVPSQLTSHQKPWPWWSVYFCEASSCVIAKKLTMLSLEEKLPEYLDYYCPDSPKS